MPRGEFNFSIEGENKQNNINKTGTIQAKLIFYIKFRKTFLSLVFPFSRLFNHSPSVRVMSAAFSHLALTYKVECFSLKIFFEKKKFCHILDKILTKLKHQNNERVINCVKEGIILWSTGLHSAV